MVNSQPNLDATFAALADPTRRAILARLALEETSVTELARPFAMSLPAVWKHVDVLERAGLLEAHKDGRVKRCKLEAAPLAEASAWIAHYKSFWESQLDALDQYLRQLPQEEEHPWPPDKHKRNRPSRSASGSRESSRPRAKGSSKPGPKPKR